MPAAVTCLKGEGIMAQTFAEFSARKERIDAAERLIRRPQGVDIGELMDIDGIGTLNQARNLIRNLRERGWDVFHTKEQRDTVWKVRE